ncbi:MAG: DUF3108 domain-containing protein [Gemmatimonadales bacterium]|nr:DUF3108 domain-containing protein [Gemmatimonadales bacterium]
MTMLVSLTSLVLAVAPFGPQSDSLPGKRTLDSYPFQIGERLDYSAKIGMLRLGDASIQVAALDTVRGVPTFRFRYSIEGGNFLFKINSVSESWTSIDEFKSLRFRHNSQENDKTYLRDYDIFPDSGFYRQRGKEGQQPTPPQPLDDASLLYFVRTTPLEIGQVYRFDKYFINDKNPLVIRVLKRERMDLPDGSKVDCLVLNPVIDDKGMFADRAEARLWITDDARRIPVQIRSKYPWGTVTLRIEKMTLAGD